MPQSQRPLGKNNDDEISNSFKRIGKVYIAKDNIPELTEGAIIDAITKSTEHGMTIPPVRYPVSAVLEYLASQHGHAISLSTACITGYIVEMYVERSKVDSVRYSEEVGRMSP